MAIQAISSTIAAANPDSSPWEAHSCAGRPCRKSLRQGALNDQQLGT